MYSKLVKYLLVLTIPFYMGCNIFGGMSSDDNDPEALLEQGRTALQQGKYVEALGYLDKAMDKDPDNYDIRYYHSVATVRVNGLDFQTFIDTFQNEDVPAKISADQPGYSIKSDTLFNLDDSTLINIVNTFFVVQGNLEPLVRAMENGTLLPGDFPYYDDVLLSHGISSIVTSMILMLDDDQIYPEFSLDESFSLQKDGDAFVLQYTGTTDPGDIWNTRIAPQLPGIQNGLRSLYYYYAWVQCSQLPNAAAYDQIEAGADPTTCEGDSGDSPVWDVFIIVFNGINGLMSNLIGTN